MKERFAEKESMSVRTATIDDAAAIARIQHESWVATYPNEEAGITKADLENHLGDVGSLAERWTNRLRLDAANADFIGTVYVLEVSGRVVGFCKVARGTHSGHVDALYLDPECTQKGLGGELFQKGLDWLGTKDSIELEVTSYNDRAIRFYKRYGFRKQGETKPLELKGGKTIPLTLMVRDRQDE